MMLLKPKIESYTFGLQNKRIPYPAMHFFKGYVGIDLMIKMCDTVTEEMDWRKI
jgi:hypothetical protein